MAMLFVCARKKKDVGVGLLPLNIIHKRLESSAVFGKACGSRDEENAGAGMDKGPGCGDQLQGK
jgi:hypothetical protein